MAEPFVNIQIKAQPQEFYRERYISELDPKRNRAQRFIRANPNPDNFDYPAVEIPKHLSSKSRLYVRVTAITILSEQVPVHCVHPYPIDTPEFDVIKDLERNTLFFHITEDDFRLGFKSFRITRKKLVQYDLRQYGPLRLLNKDEIDIQRIPDITDARKFIDLYQLRKSQLVFSLAELISPKQLPIIYDATSTSSIVMTAISGSITGTNDEDATVRYVPNRCYWYDGQEVLMFIPKIDRRKTCRVMFDHPSMRDIDDIQIEYIDTKTISFVTPSCPISTTGNEKIRLQLVVIQGSEEIARVNFTYHSLEQCPTCHASSILDSSDDSESLMPSTDENDFFLN